MGLLIFLHLKVARHSQRVGAKCCSWASNYTPGAFCPLKSRFETVAASLKKKKNTTCDSGDISAKIEISLKSSDNLNSLGFFLMQLTFFHAPGGGQSITYLYISSKCPVQFDSRHVMLTQCLCIGTAPLTWACTRSRHDNTARLPAMMEVAEYGLPWRDAEACLKMFKDVLPCSTYEIRRLKEAAMAAVLCFCWF